MTEDCIALSCPVPKVSVQDYLNQYSLNGVTVSNTQATFIISGIPITIPSGTINIHLPTRQDGTIIPNGPTTMTYQGCSGPISLPVPAGSTSAQIQAIAQHLAQLAAAQLAACNIHNQPVPPTPPPAPAPLPTCFDFNTLMWGHGGEGSGGGTGNSAAASLVSSGAPNNGCVVGSNIFNIFVPVGCDRHVHIVGNVAVAGIYVGNVYTVSIDAGGPGTIYLVQGNSGFSVDEIIPVSWTVFNGNKIEISLGIDASVPANAISMNFSIEIDP